MARRAVPEDAITRVLDRFGEVGLIDDAAFASAWVASRHHGRGLARRALAAELRRKGVAEEVAADALSAVTSDDEEAAAEALVRRRLASMSEVPRDVRIRRLVAMLGRKGFGGSLAYRVVTRLIDETGAVEPGDVACRGSQAALSLKVTKE
jgi:regulatory protein